MKCHSALLALGLTFLCIPSALPFQGDATLVQDEPKVVTRTEQYYVAIRSQAALGDLDTVIPASIREVFQWLKSNGIEQTGPPFTRFLVVDMPARFDIEIGVPVARPVKEKGRIHGGSFPAGRYVTYLFKGDPRGLVKANAFVHSWAQEKSIELDRTQTKDGVAWAARYESYVFSPLTEPDRSNWQTEIDYLVRQDPGK